MTVASTRAVNIHVARATKGTTGEKSSRRRVLGEAQKKVMLMITPTCQMGGQGEQSRKGLLCRQRMISHEQNFQYLEGW